MTRIGGSDRDARPQAKVPAYTSSFSLLPFMHGIQGENDWSCGDVSSQMDQIWDTLASVDAEALDELRSDSTLQSFIRMMMPSMRVLDEINFITAPYSLEPISMTSRAKAVFMTEDYWITLAGQKVDLDDMHEGLLHMRLIDAQILILNKLFDQHFPKPPSSIITLRHKDRSFDQYYHVVINHEFVNVISRVDLPDLDEDQIDDLYNHLGDVEYWENVMSSSEIRFEGFCMVNFVDVTETENYSRLATDLQAASKGVKIDELSKLFTDRFRSYFQAEDIDVGFNPLKEIFDNVHPDSNLTGWTNREVKHKLNDANFETVYKELSQENPSLILKLRYSSDDKFQQVLVAKGYKNLLLYAFFKDDAIDLILEIGSKDKHKLNNANARSVLNLVNLLQKVWNENQSIFDNVINSVMQRHFTAIHPTIEWRFKEAATRYYAKYQYDSKVQMDPIVFNDLVPLYGQADIVGSSMLRNTAIRADLLHNLELLQSLMEQWSDTITLNMLDNKLNTIRHLHADLNEAYDSTLENVVVSLLIDDVHPYLASIKERYDLPDEPYANYLSHLDEHLEIVYDQRKKYEDSVKELNLEIACYLENEDNKMQRVLPHYFEKYKTDGVEYNIYLGRSLTQDHNYQDFDLTEFKIWQLKAMCGIARLVQRMQSSLVTPMLTAQLVFVYNHKLSIRFRMDEKRFDVDGTYNVRYEILKKRIDKATILSTNDRLTQAGKIAIVYLNDSDRDEYVQHLNYLADSNYIDGDIEMLELNPMQGVGGLRALRVTVKH